MTEQRIRIGDMLVRAKLIDELQLAQALESQKRSGRRLGEELVALGLIGESQLTQILSNQLSVPWVSLYHIEFSRELLNLVPPDLALREKLIPVYVRKVRKQGDTLFVAMDDPSNTRALEMVGETSRLPTKPMIAPPNDIVNAIRVYYFGGRLPGEEEATEVQLEAPVAEAAAPAEAPKKKKAKPKPKKTKPKPKPKPKKATRQASEPPSGDGAIPKGPRMVTLTLLDGTTVRLPSPGGGRSAPDEEEEATAGQALTASDLVSALLARAQGADVSDVLPGEDWETLFATLLRILIRKGLIADWEFVEELKKLQGEQE